MNATHLEGKCYVVTPDELAFTQTENWKEAPVIHQASGADAISQYYAQIEEGKSPVRAYPGSDTILYIISGEGMITISGRTFSITKEMGVYIKPHEAFSIENKNATPIVLTVNVCPECEEPTWLADMPANFDDIHPDRTVALADQEVQATGDRFFQLLVDKKIGSEQVTQFIGAIPKSKAPDHFHLYEEAITVLSGKGIMWAGETNTPIGPGSMIYLPRKQVHCLQCTVDEGLKLMGFFYPAGSPTVSYET